METEQLPPEPPQQYTLIEMLEIIHGNLLQVSNNLSWLINEYRKSLEQGVQEQSIQEVQQEAPKSPKVEKKQVEQYKPIASKETLSEKEARNIITETFFNEMGRQMSVDEYVEFKEMMLSGRVKDVFEFMDILRTHEY